MGLGKSIITVIGASAVISSGAGADMFKPESLETKMKCTQITKNTKTQKECKKLQTKTNFDSDKLNIDVKITGQNISGNIGNIIGD